MPESYRRSLAVTSPDHRRASSLVRTPSSPSARYSLLAPLVVAHLLLGCGESQDSSPDPSLSDAGVMSDPDFVASCTYVNGFAMSDECREYRGPGWSDESAAADCAQVFVGLPGTYVANEPCGLDDEIGRCTVGELGDDGYEIVSAGDASTCGAARTGCETFAGGTFAPGAACQDGCEFGAEEPGAVFTPPYVDCRDPMPGEPVGMTEGQVCTPTLISASTEPGRRYADYASCDVVRTQRPYYAMPPTERAAPDDPRLLDVDYMADVAWLKQQAESSACACCHSASETPAGAAVWDTEAGPIWTDTLGNEALAMIAGFTDSAAFGYFPKEDNNGFDRSETGLPTTDRDRLVAFVEAELARRGVSLEQAAELPPFAPFFRELIEFEPADCPEGVGVDDEGVLRWIGGAARYVTVLQAGAQAPGVPPNWDMPEGTLWDVAVPPSAPAIGCGGAYGELPEGATQRVPAEGPPPVLESGETYFLYVQRDIAQPITRCLFTAP